MDTLILILNWLIIAAALVVVALAALLWSRPEVPLLCARSRGPVIRNREEHTGRGDNRQAYCRVEIDRADKADLNFIGPEVELAWTWGDLPWSLQMRGLSHPGVGTRLRLVDKSCGEVFPQLYEVTRTERWVHSDGSLLVSLNWIVSFGRLVREEDCNESLEYAVPKTDA